MSAPILEHPRSAGLSQGLVDDAVPGDGVDFRALAAALWERRWKLARGAVVGGALALALAFVLPPTYVANIAVLEAPRPGGGSALDQLGLSAEMLGLKSGGSGSNALTYPDILRSRRLLQMLLGQQMKDRKGTLVRIEDHILPGKPSPQRTELAEKELRLRLDIGLDRRTNLLRIGVKDRDPVLAAGMANAACASLQELLTNAMTTQAGANRRFIEQRLALAERELERSEGALRAFRETNMHVDGSPRLMLEQARLIRLNRTREEVVIALTRQYEIARVDENRDVPVLNVLDPAVPPAFATSPRRGAMTGGGIALGLVAAALLSFRPKREAVVAERVQAAA